MLAGEKILFIRGGSGTGGSVNGGTTAQRDAQMADITNTSTATNNAGWGQLAQLLRDDGFIVSQVLEGAYPNSTPIDLAGMDLSQYAAIIFGSNNADYTPNGSQSHVNALKAYINNGGGALFVSDANFARTWGGAATSDQDLLNPFGLVMNQDRLGVITVSRSAGLFNNGTHPILSGINTIAAEGVSFLTKPVKQIAEVTTQILIRARDGTRENDNVSGKGTDRNVTINDASLVVASYGKGRVVGSLDRNTFFNSNGIGTNLDQYDNEEYALNLFRFVAGRFTSRPQVVAGEFRYELSPHVVRTVFSEPIQTSFTAGDLSIRNLTTGRTYLPKSVSWNSSSNRADWQLGGELPDGTYRATLSPSRIIDGTGNAMTSAYALDFFVLSGDLNRDGTVNNTDGNILKSNFAVKNIGKMGGDLNGNGVVESTDFAHLAARYAKSSTTPFSVVAPQIQSPPLFMSGIQEAPSTWSDLPVAL